MNHQQQTQSKTLINTLKHTLTVHEVASHLIGRYNL